MFNNTSKTVSNNLGDCDPTKCIYGRFQFFIFYFASVTLLRDNIQIESSMNPFLNLFIQRTKLKFWQSYSIKKKYRNFISQASKDNSFQRNFNEPNQ